VQTGFGHRNAVWAVIVEPTDLVFIGYSAPIRCCGFGALGRKDSK
jgi:hypothetical protein